ncbi:hypothetical protein ACTFIZ_001061 [Dictyostelium cf. discoideum]
MKINQLKHIIQYLFENVFNVTTSNIRHFKFSIENSTSLQSIIKLILSHINTIQLYSIKIKITGDILESTLDEIINLSNKFSEKQQQQSNKSFKNLVEFKIIVHKCKNHQIKQNQLLLNNKICHFDVSVLNHTNK